jgi:hypothetical protein
MYKNLNLFFILILLINKLVCGQNFIPEPQIGQVAVPVANKIYYTGGIVSKSNMIYLDLDKGWVDLTSQGVYLPPKAGHAADIGGANQDLIFMIGGYLEEQNVVYQFDTKTNALIKPIIQGITPPGRNLINAVSYKGKIYVYGGINDSNEVIYNVGYY